jgi:hypothetical protein
VNLAQANAPPGFKTVCPRCGCLSIKVADPVNVPCTTSVQCGRCGTLADLHDLARQSGDVFEF